MALNDHLKPTPSNMFALLEVELELIFLKICKLEEREELEDQTVYSFNDAADLLRSLEDWYDSNFD